MAMNDEETVALIAGGHTFGKTHGAGDPSLVGPEPESGAHRGSGPRLEEQAWHRHRRRRHHRRPGGHLDADADQVEQPLLRQPVQVRMGADQEPGRREAVEGEGRRGHDPGRVSIRRRSMLPTMLTTDLALRFDPAYEKISRRFYEHPDQFADAFARAWFKLTHRDMGPIARYLGPLVPKETLIWQDPIPAVDHPLIGEQDIAALKAKILASGLSVSQLVSTAWASASTFRGSDKRGGANGARIRLAPAEGLGGQPAGPADDGAAKLEAIQKECRQEGFARRPDRSRRLRGGREGREGCRRRREGALHAGPHGRVAGADRRRLLRAARAACRRLPQLHQQQEARSSWQPEEALVDRAQLLRLTAPEMTVLVGGLRVLGANAGDSKHGVFTKQPEKLTNDFFVNLLDMSTEWQPAGAEGVYEGRDRKTKAVKWTGTRVDLIFGSHSQLRALRGGLCVRRLEGEVREGLRGGVDQGDERRPLRPRLISAESSQRTKPRSRSREAGVLRSACVPSSRR